MLGDLAAMDKSAAQVLAFLQGPGARQVIANYKAGGRVGNLVVAGKSALDVLKAFPFTGATVRNAKGATFRRAGALWPERRDFDAWAQSHAAELTPEWASAVLAAVGTAAGESLPMTTIREHQAATRKTAAGGKTLWVVGGVVALGIVAVLVRRRFM